MDAGLRFAVGDRVSCKTSRTQWQSGTIVKLQYREEHWQPGQTVPYQIELDSGVAIYAPQDSECLIRAENCTTQDIGRSVEIHVCQAGPCRRAGGEAVLLEIEELARSVGGCMVQPSGCLGNCSNAPNALLSRNGSERVFARLCTISSTADIIEQACGLAPSLDDAELVGRLQRARQLRVRVQAREESKWNLALSGLAEACAQEEDADERAGLVQEHAELLLAAGFAEMALSVLSAASPEAAAVRLCDMSALRLLYEQARVLARLGRCSAINEMRAIVLQLTPAGRHERRLQEQLGAMLEQTARSCAVPPPASAPPASAPAKIEGYTRWQLLAVTPVSKHSAIYHLVSDDVSRGTPIVRGRGGRSVWSRTWHTTMLAHVGRAANAEGPLPWVERDYTPISTAHEWEQGRCDLLVKVYLQPPGLATGWLHSVAAGLHAANPSIAGGSLKEMDFAKSSRGLDPDAAAGRAAGTAAAIAAGEGRIEAAGDGAGVMVWLSRPAKTLQVPSLASEERFIRRKHSSVLLLVAGTGVVAVPQVLHHTKPATCFAPARPPPICQPVSVVYSCRSDDVLLLPELAGWCKDRSLARCTVLTTTALDTAAPFPHMPDADVAAAFEGLDNARWAHARLSRELLQAELSKMEKPMRVVISGPEGFNAACTKMLKHIDQDLGTDAVTVLCA